MKRSLILLAALSAPLILSAAATADGCRRVQVQRGVIHHQTVYQDVHHGYAVTQFLQVPVPAYPVYGIGPGAGEQLQKLEEEIALLRRAILAQPINPVPDLPDVTPEPPLRKAPPPTGGEKAKPAKAGAKAKASAFQNPKLLAYVRAECSKCHSEAGRQDKGLALLTADGLLAEPGELARLKAFRAVSTGAMPQGGGKPPSDEVLALFAEWAESK